MPVTTAKPHDRGPDLDTLSSVRPDGSRNAIHPAQATGRYQTWRRWLWVFLIAIYLALPWLDVGGHPAFLIDIARRHFFLLGHTFTAQDFWLAFFFVSGVGFLLIMVSALLGRLWCGYGCPQTVFLEGVFRTLERWIEGSPRQRRELDRAPWLGRRIVKRIVKWILFLGIALLLAHTALSYFMPVEQVFAAVTRPPAEHPTAFLFVAALTAAMFVNFTWFREQLCIVVCPYGRLQSVLYDQHTINVGYDRRRGEPRGKGTGRGDCIDCLRCVAVCPTGIDIRNGTQLECVGCAACADACDEVMARLGRPGGLVRYDSEAGLAGAARRFLRPRVLLYSALLLLGVVVFAIAASRRVEFEARLLRLTGSPYTIDGEMVSNALSLHVENKQPAAEKLHVRAEAPSGVEVVLPVAEVELESLTDRRIPLLVRFRRGSVPPGERLWVVVTGSSREQRLWLPLLAP